MSDNSVHTLWHVRSIALAMLHSFILLSTLSLAPANADPYLPAANGEVVIEAENFDRNVSRGGRDWVADYTSGFVGASAMRASPDSWKSVKNNIAADSPRMDYEVNYSTATTVHVWVRGLGSSGSADSIWVGIDGNDSQAIRIDPTRGSWGWEAANERLTIPAGTHTINVWMREDGTIVDRLFLTPSTNAPVGDGGAESPRSGGSSGGSENTWPVANDDVFSVVNDGTSHLLDVLADNGQGEDFDPDGDTIAISSVDDLSNSDSSVTIDSASAGIYFTPGAGTDRTESFSYTIEDGRGGSGTAAVSVSITSESGGNGGNGDGAFVADSSGQVVFEAENYERKFRRSNRDWVADFTGGFVGVSAMRTSPNSFLSVKNNLSANSPRMDYPVHFESSVSANVWLRGFGPSSSANSVWVGINGNENSAVQISPPISRWGWETSQQKLLIPAGAQTINVWMREDGTVVDRVMLTPSSNRPSGSGPTESGRDDDTGSGSPTNQAPIISGSPPANVTAGSSYSFTPAASDPDNDPLTFSANRLPNWLSINTSTGRLSGVPDNQDTGTYSNISITVSDGMETATLGPFSIIVEDENVGSNTGSVTLSWTRPDKNEDGSALNNLDSYRIYWGTILGSYPNSVTISDPTVTSYVVEDLPFDDYYFVATTINSSGVESAFSNSVTRTVP